MSERRFAAIIWDVDGTLVDSIDLITDALQRAIVEHGGPLLTPEEIVARFGPTEEGVLRGIVGDRWEDAIEMYLADYERGHDGLAFERVRDEVLRLSEAGLPMAVVTGKGERSAAVTLRLIGLDHVFDQVAAGSMDGSVKADKISDIVDAWGMPPEEVAYIGDAPSDVREARAAGVVPVSAAWMRGARVEELAALEPFAVLEDEQALVDWVESYVAVPD